MGGDGGSRTIIPIWSHSCQPLRLPPSFKSNQVLMVSRFYPRCACWSPCLEDHSHFPSAHHAAELSLMGSFFNFLYCKTVTTPLIVPAEEREAQRWERTCQRSWGQYTVELGSKDQAQVRLPTPAAFALQPHYFVSNALTFPGKHSPFPKSGLKVPSSSELPRSLPQARAGHTSTLLPQPTMQMAFPHTSHLLWSIQLAAHVSTSLDQGPSQLPRSQILAKGHGHSRHQWGFSQQGIE